MKTVARSSIDDPETSFFMRSSFPGIPSREPMKAVFFEKIPMPMLEKYEVVVHYDLGEIVISSSGETSS